MDIKAILNKLVTHHHLTLAEMDIVITAVMQGQTTPAQTAAFLTALTAKGETVEELTAAGQVLKSYMTPVQLKPYPHLVDIVGTGGDQAHLFNVSTTAAFVVAAAGGSVAKHGNRATSSKSGSADVLTCAGAHLDLSAEQIANCIETVGIGFLFAPRHHPAMQNVRHVRQEIGVRTLFNLLGPITNPASVSQQLVGVYSKKWLKPIAQVLQKLGSTHAMVVHAADGLDEISCAAPTFVAELKNGSITEYVIKPETFDIHTASLNTLMVDSPEQSLAILQQVFANQAGPARDIVILNAGATLYCAGLARNIVEGTQFAAHVIVNGSTAKKFSDFIALTQTFK